MFKKKGGGQLLKACYLQNASSIYSLFYNSDCGSGSPYPLSTKADYGASSCTCKFIICMCLHRQESLDTVTYFFHITKDFFKCSDLQWFTFLAKYVLPFLLVKWAQAGGLFSKFPWHLEIINHGLSTKTKNSAFSVNYKPKWAPWNTRFQDTVT